MPREAIHWTALSRVLKKLDRPPFSTLFPAGGTNAPGEARTNFAALYLGAMAHDAPYYYRFGGADFESVAEMLHGSDGNDTFDPFRSMAEAILMRPEAERPVLWAFLLGMISHYAVDTVFHPMIYFFTGDYYHPDPALRLEARGRHRLLETYLDSWATPKLEQWNRFSINGTIKALGSSIDTVCAVLGKTMSDVPGQDASTAWRRALKYLGDLQAIFHSDIAGRIFRGCNFIVGGKLTPIEALFIYRRRKSEPLLDRPLLYTNPATGEQVTKSTEDLLNESVEKCVWLFEQLAPLISGDSNNVTACIGGIKGESLNFGIVGATYPDAKSFSAEGLPLEGLNLKTA